MSSSLLNVAVSFSETFNGNVSLMLININKWRVLVCLLCVKHYLRYYNKRNVTSALLSAPSRLITLVTHEHVQPRSDS